MRLITDKDGRLKGFGYAEFGTLQALMDALVLSGEVSEHVLTTVSVSSFLRC